VCFILSIYLIVYVVCCQCTREDWLTTLCGLTLGLVLQVLVAAWFALVQVKVLALRGLRGVERQVGLVRGTRWPTGSSASRMVQEEQDEVVDRSRCIGGGQVKERGRTE
jgi:hypothetical protein